jgi:hypothetical protein
MLPTSQAGHQTHQTTTGVYIPHTSQPNAASFNTSPKLSPQKDDQAKMMVVGATSSSSILLVHRMAAFLGHGWAKVSGLARRPTKKAKEKLSVARDERNMPSSRRENDLVSWYSCCDALYFVRKWEKTCGRAKFRAEKTTKAGASI